MLLWLLKPSEETVNFENYIFFRYVEGIIFQEGRDLATSSRFQVQFEYICMFIKVSHCFFVQMSAKNFYEIIRMNN